MSRLSKLPTLTLKNIIAESLTEAITLRPDDNFRLYPGNASAQEVCAEFKRRHGYYPAALIVRSTVARDPSDLWLTASWAPKWQILALDRGSRD